MRSQMGNDGTASHIGQEPGRQSVEIPLEKAYELAKLEVVRDLQNELTDWARRRFWVISIVTAVVGVVGLNALVSITLQNLYADKIQTAIEATTRADIASQDAETALGELGGRLEAIDQELTRLESNSEELVSETEALRTQQQQIAIETRTATDKKLAILERELTDTRRILELLAERIVGGSEVVETYEKSTQDRDIRTPQEIDAAVEEMLMALDEVDQRKREFLVIDHPTEPTGFMQFNGFDKSFRLEYSRTDQTGERKHYFCHVDRDRVAIAAESYIRQTNIYLDICRWEEMSR